MSATFYSPKLCSSIEAVIKSCPHCQKYKNVLPRGAGLLLWSEVTVDMIGPWTIEVGNQTEKFSALMIIDLVTNLVEIVCVTNKISAAITAHFVNAWLAHYPKPNVMYTSSRLGIHRMEFPSNVTL
jgi:uncharacterized protein CbrC (UPF0167 family)